MIGKYKRDGTLIRTVDNTPKTVTSLDTKTGEVKVQRLNTTKQALERFNDLKKSKRLIVTTDAAAPKATKQSEPPTLPLFP
jgi:hypothetical protein